MNVKPISGATLSYKGIKRTENGNIYHTTNSGTITGLTVGTALGGLIIHRGLTTAPKHMKPLSILSAAIFIGATGLGYLVDKNTELARSRMADGYIKPADFY